MPRDLMKVVESSPAELDALTLSFVQERAEAIRGLARQTAENIVRIGEHLVAVKERLGHGNWLPWLEGEFGWSDETARKFMRVHDMVKSQQRRNLEVDQRQRFLTCSPRRWMPSQFGNIASKVAAAGQKVTHKLVKQQIAQVQTLAVKLASDPPIIDVVADPAGELHSEPVDQRLALKADMEYKNLSVTCSLHGRTCRPTLLRK